MYPLIPCSCVAPPPFLLPTGIHLVCSLYLWVWFCFVIFISLFILLSFLILTVLSHHTWTVVVLLLWAYFLLFPSLTHIVLAITMPHKIFHPQVLWVLPCNDLNHQKKTQMICHMDIEAIFFNTSFQPVYLILCVLRCMCAIRTYIS